MQVEWYGQSAFRLTDGETTVFIDPHELGRFERVSAGHARSIRCRIVLAKGERRLGPGERSSPEQVNVRPTGAAGLAITGIEPARRLGLPMHPWRFALLIAASVGLLGFAAGWYAEGDPGSGVVRGGFEAVALLVCFAALGRTLGLRRSR